ncbi:zf-HC2 domain-containing protein [Granulicella arctica]|uniref:zf-HC2 domain-containing protein n=1 Tax=Granulicella arctica TaxID=940613 RepID=UPI0021DF696B|nr:zf-HC2 domain-containing protein [Granulicella arctica]
MAKFNQDLPQFGSAKPANTGGSQHCAQCEAMLADVMDGTLSAEDQTRFDQHLAGCVSCSQMLAEAERGAAWLEMLRTPQPEPPDALLELILARTSGIAPSAQLRNLSILPTPNTLIAPTASLAGAGSALPVRTAAVLPFRSRVAAAFHVKSIGQSLLQPRLAMTAAMAFFSIGLTLNLTGVRLNELRASDLKPSSVKRSFYQANAHVVRYVDNLRAVYELESRVRDLQRSTDNDIPASPQSTDKKDDSAPGTKNGQPDQKQNRPRTGSGTSRRQVPADPMSLASLYFADFTTSPSLSLVRVSATTSSTLQEGEFV